METRAARDRISAEVLSQLSFYENRGLYNVVNIAEPGASNPDFIKELFSSKNGLMKRLAGCKGLGSSDFEKLYKRINAKRKELTSAENLSDHYYEIVAKISGATQDNIDKIKLCEQMINGIEKNVKKFIKKFKIKYNSKTFARMALVNGGIGIIYGASIGALAGEILSLPIAITFPPAIFAGIAIGAAAGTAAGAAIGAGMAGGSVDLAEYEIRQAYYGSNSEKFLKDLKTELKGNKNKNLDYKLSPRTVFLELNNGKIGVLISPKIVAFEPQSEIKDFYNEYKSAIRILNDELKLLNLEVFKPKFNNSKKYMTKEMRKIIKNTQDYSNFIDYVKSECRKYLAKKEKGVPNDKKNQKLEDKAKIAFAKFCTKLTYTPLREEEIGNAITRARKYVITDKMTYKYKKVNNLINESQETSDLSVPATVNLQVLNKGAVKTETAKTETAKTETVEIVI